MSHHIRMNDTFKILLHQFEMYVTRSAGNVAASQLWSARPVMFHEKCKAFLSQYHRDFFFFFFLKKKKKQRILPQ